MSVQPKIMVFTDWYEPGFKAGGPIRSCVNFAAYMKEDYAIYIFTGDRDLGDKQAYLQIETNRWIEKDGVQLFYASPGALNWESILVHVRDIKPDYIYLNNMYSKYFTIYPLLMKRFGLITAKVILAPRGMLKSTAVQYKPGKKKFFFQLLKLLNIPGRIVFHATDSTEEADIKNLFGEAVPTKQISNFPPMQKDLQPIYKESGSLKIIFTGRVHPIKNLAFLLRCLHLVAGSVMLTIVATIEDEGYWLKCREIIESLPQPIAVELRQDVPHQEIEELINAHHLFVLPTLGENFGHAIFEALSAGRPVLISDQTPWRSLQEQHAGWDLPLSNEKEFVRVLQEVAGMDDEAFQQWSAGAWQYARNFMESSNLKEKYKELFS
ncbi:glycosyltransferase family 4 protein [Agriterribacter sp.]|uniref:glycosyltransferase family 4 protein n=1 Tax=Agriterribacter sp. TaxID=2821509 RepID=UPI002B70DC38|nr:glycosyltransferase family 4 protein [Agriterribacter sp.]HRO44563.1 glycosyltransferase family 4 protein [Agriterribacter sp.]HRQ16000.1 glycosyltransferase family 4 protein [Agriterribacter sp.]